MNSAHNSAGKTKMDLGRRYKLYPSAMQKKKEKLQAHPEMRLLDDDVVTTPRVCGKTHSLFGLMAGLSPLAASVVHSGMCDKNLPTVQPISS